MTYAAPQMTYGAPAAYTPQTHDIAHLPYQHERLQERMDLFRECDPNGNGFLSFAEIDAVFRNKYGTGETEKMMMLHAFNASKNLGAASAGPGQDYIEHNEFRTFLEFVARGNAPAPTMHQINPHLYGAPQPVTYAAPQAMTYAAPSPQPMYSLPSAQSMIAYPQQTMMIESQPQAVAVEQPSANPPPAKAAVDPPAKKPSAKKVSKASKKGKKGKKGCC